MYPGHDDIGISRGAHNEEWLPVIGEAGLVVITRDKRIRRRPIELRMWVRYKVRGFVLTGRMSQSTDSSLEVLEAHWGAIEQEIASGPSGPWTFSVTREGLRRIDLPGGEPPDRVSRT